MTPRNTVNQHTQHFCIYLLNIHVSFTVPLLMIADIYKNKIKKIHINI